MCLRIVGQEERIVTLQSCLTTILLDVGDPHLKQDHIVVIVLNHLVLHYPTELGIVT